MNTALISVVDTECSQKLHIRPPLRVTSTLVTASTRERVAEVKEKTNNLRLFLPYHYAKFTCQYHNRERTNWIVAIYNILVHTYVTRALRVKYCTYTK